MKLDEELKVFGGSGLSELRVAGSSVFPWVLICKCVGGKWNKT